MPDDVPDGTSNTLLVVSVKDTVPWSSPQDVAYDPNGPLPRFADHFRAGFTAALADGSVRLTVTLGGAA